MLWLSLLFGHFSTNYIYSGTIGYELNEFLIIYIGNIGVISTLLFILLSYLVIRLKITPENTFSFIKSIIPKFNKIKESSTEKNDDVIESIEENKISTSKFNFKNEEAKPTIQNFSSHSTKKEEILESENDEIKIEI